MTWTRPKTDHYTLDDWLATPEADGYHYELIDGRIVVAPVGSDEHHYLRAKLMRIFGNWEEDYHLGTVRGESNIVFGPAHALIPDAAILLNDHLGTITK